MMTNIDVKIRNPYNNCILRKIIYHQYLPMLIGISDPLGAQTDRLRYWNFVSSLRECTRYDLLHQSLPFTVLKLKSQCPEAWHIFVATAPTVHGIETLLH